MSTRQRNSTKSQSKSNGPTAKRRVVVLVALVGVLTLTSALLLAIAPAPLSTQTPASLLAVDSPQSFDELFESPSVPVDAGKWHYIYIHHSNSPAGNATTLAGNDSMTPDHFVIGNGDGAADGEIQIGLRWKQQLPPGRTPGADAIIPTCISICLIGDFNQTRPTPTQQRQLVQLVTALQNRLHIPAGRVTLFPQTDSPAGIGAFFPASDFKKQILP